MKIPSEESLLYGALENHFKKRGYHIINAHEIRIGVKSMDRADLIAIGKDFSIIIIEVKMTAHKQLLNQLLKRLFYGDYVYAALPEGKARTFMKKFMKLLKRYGVGVLSVEGEHVNELLKANKSKHTLPYMKIKIVNKLLKRGKNIHE